MHFYGTEKKKGKKKQKTLSYASLEITEPNGKIFSWEDTFSTGPRATWPPTSESLLLPPICQEKCPISTNTTRGS